MITPSDYANQLSHEYERIHTTKEDAFWTTYMGLADDADAARKELAKLEIALNKFLQDPERLARTRTELARARESAAPAATVQALEGWVRTFEAHAIESDEGRALAEEIVEMEAELAKARAKMKLGYQIPGQDFVEASSVKLAMLINNDKDEATRRAAWEGLRSIENHVLEHGFLDIVRERNRLGRMLGATDYYDWKVRRVEGMSKREIFALLDALETKTREHGRAAMEELRGRLGEAAGQPWSLTYSISGDITKAQDPYFPFSESLERWGRTFAGLGIRYRGAEMVLDLVDRKGKYENGFMHGPVPAWRENDVFRPARIHFTANAIPGMVGAGRRATETLFHEGGHAAHFANIDMPAPCFAQEFAPSSVSLAETQSMFLDSLLSDADWQTRYARTKDGAAMPWELIERAVRETQPYTALRVRAGITVCYCERALYELPEDELTAENVLRVLRGIESRMLFMEEGSPRPVLSIPHLLSGEASAYYHGYYLALMAVHQTRNFFLKRDGHLVDNPRIGPDLTQAYWKPGNSRRFPEFIRDLTGEEVSPDALAENATRSVEETIARAKAKVAKLADIPVFEPEPELGAEIRVIHGREQVCATGSGFEDAAQKFAAWIEAQE